MAVSMTSRTFTLNTGDRIPAIGLGTWQSKPDQVTAAVTAALQVGYRHIDTAAAYGNEHEVGEGIRASGVPREKIWITTKLNNPDHKRAAEALGSSLKNLGVDYLDLWLMHWPSSTVGDQKVHYEDWDYCDTWTEMQKALETGKVKNIGVSNFGIRHLQTLLADPRTKVTPAVNQIELHPCNPSPKLIAHCKSLGIHCTGYSCLGSTNSPLESNKSLLSIAAAVNKTAQQVLLLWGLQHGWSVLPKSITKSRIEGNFDLNGVKLDEDMMAQLDFITDRFKVCGHDWLPRPVFFHDDE